MSIDCGPNVQHTMRSYPLDNTDFRDICVHQFIYTDFGKAITLLTLHIHNGNALALWNDGGKFINKLNYSKSIQAYPIIISFIYFSGATNV